MIQRRNPFSLLSSGSRLCPPGIPASATDSSRTIKTVLEEFPILSNGSLSNKVCVTPQTAALPAWDSAPGGAESSSVAHPSHYPRGLEADCVSLSQVQPLGEWREKKPSSLVLSCVSGVRCGAAEVAKSIDCLKPLRCPTLNTGMPWVSF